MRNNFTLLLSLFFGAVLVLILVCLPQCEGAKYVNSLDLDDDEMSILLDELSLPHHRIMKERPKRFSCGSTQSATGKSTAVILDDYIVLRKRLTWIEAISECANQSKQLAALPTVQDAKLLVEEIRAISQAYYGNYNENRKLHEFGMDRRYWIGLTDLIQEGTWQWVGSGSELNYNFWFKDRPTHLAGGKSKHCGCLANPSYHLGDHHHFIDDDCTKKYYAICGDLLKSSVTISTLNSDVVQLGMGYMTEYDAKAQNNDNATFPSI
ncbi:unnamed protein product [Orchesella dallaii]|uniref:C-type lectin domain-containing protein n=1 Tax=Orchesella dallaii TaxID=48710 RepID=A0ABP1Q2P1_9HEXA